LDFGYGQTSEKQIYDERKRTGKVKKGCPTFTK
jgi:hypothetical protein